MSENKTKKEKNIERDKKLQNNLDRANSVFSLRDDSSMNTYAIVLAAISLVLSMLFFVSGSVGVGFIFVGVSALLVLLVFLPKIIATIKAKKK